MSTFDETHEILSDYRMPRFITETSVIQYIAIFLKIVALTAMFLLLIFFNILCYV
jgi:hypothetical protein